MTVKSVAAAGFSCVDVYKKLGLYYPTGNGVDWGIHLARLGIPVSVVSVVGTDEYGTLMKEALKREHIDIRHLRTALGETCIMLMDLKNGTDRIHLEEIEGVMADFALTDADIAFIKTHYMMHTDLFGNVLKRLAEIHQAGVKVLMDFSIYVEDPDFGCEALFPNVDVVFFSNDQADEAYLKDLLQKIKALGPEIVTATRGEKGSLSYDGSNFFSHGVIDVQPVNTVGAGDAYIAGFTWGLLNGWDVPLCMAQGAALSAEVITRFEPY